MLNLLNSSARESRYPLPRVIPQQYGWGGPEKLKCGIRDCDLCGASRRKAALRSINF